MTATLSINGEPTQTVELTDVQVRGLTFAAVRPTLPDGTPQSFTAVGLVALTANGITDYVSQSDAANVAMVSAILATLDSDTLASLATADPMAVKSSLESVALAPSGPMAVSPSVGKGPQ